MVCLFFCRSDGVPLAVRGCGLNRFLPPIILSVCICGHVCVLSVQFSRCTFTHSYTHAYCQNWHSLFVALPTMTTSSNVKNFLSFALFYTCKVLFSYWFPQYDGTPEYFLSCHKLGLHTLPRGALVKERRPKHKLNQRFVPNCYMFSIWHLSKLLYMWGTFIVRDCLCVWAIIFNVCHSQRDGTVLHMLCNQAHSWSWIV